MKAYEKNNDDIILELKRRGIHCIIVGSYLSARNFIMYHVSAGTLVNVEDTEETRMLDLEKTVNQNGGILVYGFDNKDIKAGDGKKLIDNVEVHGSSFIYSNLERLLCGRREWNRFTYNSKVIIIMYEGYEKNKNELRKIWEEIIGIERKNSATCLASDDISIIIVQNNI